MTPPADPFERFESLLAQAWEKDVVNANAMTLSTVDAEGQPSSRQVLLKGVDDRGFVFYSNLGSRKGRELAANPRCSLNFYWRELGEQVTIRGSVEPVDDQEADEYFQSRPRGSRLGAWASRQSEVLASKASLLADVARIELRYPGEIPRPPFWSGFRVLPITFEFWREGKFRLHDRFRYQRVEGGDRSVGWQVDRLYP